MTDVPRSPSPNGPAFALDAPHDGWTLTPPRRESSLRNSFVSGDAEGQRLRVSYFVRDVDSAVVGRAWFGPLAEGPPGHAHGGSMAALLDEAMGAAAWLKGHRVLAAKITIEFKRPLPLGSVVEFTAWVERVEGRRVFTRAELSLPGTEGGTVCAQGEGLFIAVDLSKLKMSPTNDPIG